MKVVMPLGRDKATSDAQFDVMPYAGCACSKVDDKWLTEKEARQKPQIPGECNCACSFGTVNEAANDQLGKTSSEW